MTKISHYAMALGFPKIRPHAKSKHLKNRHFDSKIKIVKSMREKL